MLTGIPLVKNHFTTGQFDPEDKKIVFISYKQDPDRDVARRCAEILEGISGLCYWFDEEDKCMAEALHQKPDINLATCIERGLDVSSALLSIISSDTLDSKWVPYEIGGARGRRRFFKPFTPSAFADPPPVSHPLIAHYLLDTKQKYPAYIALGIPLVTEEEIIKWAKSIVSILGKIRGGMVGIELSKEIKSIWAIYDIQDIYEKNVRDYVY